MEQRTGVVEERLPHTATLSRIAGGDKECVLMLLTCAVQCVLTGRKMLRIQRLAELKAVVGRQFTVFAARNFAAAPQAGTAISGWGGFACALCDS